MNYPLKELEKIAEAGILLSKAMIRHNTVEIYPAGGNINFRDSVTVYNNRSMFWYNTADHGTHIVTNDLK